MFCCHEIVRRAVLVKICEPAETMWLYDAVNVILSIQNEGGGFATYELTRSYARFELHRMYIRCNSMFDIFQNTISWTPEEEIENCLHKAARFIKEIQKPDGL